MNSEERIARLEERLLWFERHVVEQDKVMLEIAEETAVLRRELKKLTSILAAGGTSEADDTHAERPPHY